MPPTPVGTAIWVPSPIDANNAVITFSSPFPNVSLSEVGLPSWTTVPSSYTPNTGTPTANALALVFTNDISAETGMQYPLNDPGTWLDTGELPLAGSVSWYSMARAAKSRIDKAVQARQKSKRRR